MLDAVASDHSVITDPEDKRKRRTIVIERNELQKFGFTVQVRILYVCTRNYKQKFFGTSVSGSSVVLRSFVAFLVKFTQLVKVLA